MLVMRECGRRVSFLIAEKSMHQRGIGFFARMVNASKYLEMVYEYSFIIESY